ncbi:hypothetical protein [Inquilinus sp. CA228]|uniref:hypothetical protein n=1 Tax=Inquilinus sp. CA228 TaxID=3455609 RepID=UPI003F8D1752
MRISIKNQAESDVCAGAIGGRGLAGKLVVLTAREPESPEPVLLDFELISVATASFLRESVVAFRDIVRGRRSKFYPVVANANDIVTEELDDILQSRGDAILSCKVADAGTISDVRVLGRLEAKQRKIFDLISERRELDAALLQREFGSDEGVKQTAWNNRLSALAQAGIVIELSMGRNKHYRPLFEGV